MAPEGARSSGNHSTQDPVTPALPRPDGATQKVPSGLPPDLPPQPPQDLTGRKLGQYTVLEKIGQGGMGLVLKAFDTALERTVALKVLLCSALDDPKQAERFMREARSMARLSHPNLLSVYNVGREGDCQYFAMELLEGETLSSALRRRGRIAPAELLRLLGQILSALHYIHLQGIVHRDVKSGNIMLCPRRAVLMDFGLAKDEALAGLTTVGAVLGTPDYMPPEAAQGLAAWLRRADGSTEEIRWIEFKANDPDPSKWQHVIERKQLDGTWARTTVSHQDFAGKEATLELFPWGVTGGAQKKQ